MSSILLSVLESRLYKFKNQKNFWFEVGQSCKNWALFDTNPTFFIVYYDQYPKESKFDQYDKFWSSLGQKYLEFAGNVKPLGFPSRSILSTAFPWIEDATCRTVFFNFHDYKSRATFIQGRPLDFENIFVRSSQPTKSLKLENFQRFLANFLPTTLFEH